MYLLTHIERYVVYQCLKEPKLWRNAKPWWFSSKEGEQIAWSAMRYRKAEGKWPHAKACIDKIDYKRNRLQPQDILQFIRVDSVDDETVKGLLDTFTIGGKLWDIAIRHHQKPIDPDAWKKLQTIADELKREPLVTIEQIRIVDYMWGRWNKLKTKNEYKQDRYRKAMLRLIKNNNRINE